jgi:hypothetical protein
MELEPYWNGTLEREGLCSSLSGYQGGSTLGPALAQERHRIAPRTRPRRCRTEFKAGGPLAKRMDKLLREGTLLAVEIAAQIGVSRWVVQRRAIALGLRVPRPRKAAA